MFQVLWAEGAVQWNGLDNLVVIKGEEGDDKLKPGNIALNLETISPMKWQLSHQSCNELIRAMENTAGGIILAWQRGARPNMPLLSDF